MKASEQKIYGRNACLAVSRFAPNSVIRAYCTESTRGTFGFLLKQLAAQKRAYHIVTSTDLNKLAESEHHEGVLLLIERPSLGGDEDLLKKISGIPKHKPTCILCLDGISNPHNLGSIVRTAAHFGIQQIVLTNIPNDQLKGLSSGAYHRTAEGGAMHVELAVSQNPTQLINTLTQQFGFTVAVTSSHAKSASLNKTKMPPRLVLVMGSESDGVSQDIMKLARCQICIDGTGHVESLNVASATAILLNEYNRQNQRVTDSPTPTKPTLAGRTLGRKRRGS